MIEPAKRCRHRHTWVFKAISVRLPMLWCYQCGAIKNGDEKWVRPTGVDGPNPAMKGAGSNAAERSSHKPPRSGHNGEGTPAIETLSITDHTTER